MRSRLIVLVAVFMLWPTMASAFTWWGWLEELSGPGPFYGGGVFVRVFCVVNDGSITTCLTDRNPNVRQIFELRGAFLTSGDKPRFQDAPADTRAVHVFRLEPVYMFRLHRALDIGAGAGFMRFSGEGFDPLNRFTITPVSVSFAPFLLARRDNVAQNSWTRIVRLRFEETYISKGFTGSDFGNSATRFSTGSEFVASVGVVVDFAALLR